MRSAKDPTQILMVSTADWDNTNWTNNQHVVVELGRRGCKALGPQELDARLAGARNNIYEGCTEKMMRVIDPT